MSTIDQIAQRIEKEIGRSLRIIRDGWLAFRVEVFMGSNWVVVAYLFRWQVNLFLSGFLTGAQVRGADEPNEQM